MSAEMQPEAVEPRVITFGDPVEHDAGVNDRESVFNDVRWALVEYGPGCGREGWCTQPHMGYLIAGELEYAFEDDRPPLKLRTGDAFALPPWPAHAGRNRGGEPARLFIIDSLASGSGTER